jgi:hypothetical protein
MPEAANREALAGLRAGLASVLALYDIPRSRRAELRRQVANIDGKLAAIDAANRPPGAICANCRHFWLTDAGELGDCRARLPQPDDRGVSRWVITHRDDGCAEFQRSDNEQ